jgi:hypothetical protein
MKKILFILFMATIPIKANWNPEAIDLMNLSKFKFFLTERFSPTVPLSQAEAYYPAFPRQKNDHLDPFSQEIRSFLTIASLNKKRPSPKTLQQFLIREKNASIPFRYYPPSSINTKNSEGIILFNGLFSRLDDPYLPAEKLNELGHPVILISSLYPYDVKNLPCSRFGTPATEADLFLDGLKDFLGLLSKNPLKRLHLIGVSYGGLIANEFYRHLIDSKELTSQNIQLGKLFLFSLPFNLQGAFVRMHENIQRCSGNAFISPTPSCQIASFWKENLELTGQSLYANPSCGLKKPFQNSREALNFFDPESQEQSFEIPLEGSHLPLIVYSTNDFLNTDIPDLPSQNLLGVFNGAHTVYLKDPSVWTGVSHQISLDFN